MPTPAQLGKPSSMGDRGGETPTNEPSFTQGGAPGGPTFGGDLPSVAVPGGKPFSTGGYRPQADQDQLPAPGSSDGCQKAPTGIRR